MMKTSLPRTDSSIWTRVSVVIQNKCCFHFPSGPSNPLGHHSLVCLVKVLANAHFNIRKLNPKQSLSQNSFVYPMMSCKKEKFTL